MRVPAEALIRWKKAATKARLTLAAFVRRALDREVRP